MSLFDFIFGKKKLSLIEKNYPTTHKNMAFLKKSIENTVKVDFLDKLMSIDSMGYSGEFNKSELEKWIISWNNSGSSSSIDGYRENVHGSYILYDNENKVIVTRGNKLERPNNGSVANNGTFSLEDWHFGNNLSGTFFVFSKEGHVILKRKLKSNIYNSAISKSGLFAVCQTANNNTEDGNKLIFFDIGNNKELFSIYPHIGWAHGYDFDESEQYLYVCINKIGKFRYDIKGNFIDRDKYREAALNSNEYVASISMCKEILDDPNIDLQEVKNIING